MVIVALSVNAVPAGNLLPIWNFDEGILTDQGGYYNHFKAGNSVASIYLVDDIRRGKGGRAMKIQFRKTDQGYCGVWIHLFDEEAADGERVYLDVFDYPYLSFWVKGEHGGEDFVVQMADAEWIDQEDSQPAGSVSKYLGGPIRTNWQEVVVPYEDFGLATPQAGGITFGFTQEGEGTVYVDDITFKKRADASVPVSDATAEPATRERKLVRAMWVWNINPLLLQADYRAEFFAFCSEHDINELFLQMPCRFVNDLTEDVECYLEHEDKLREFLAEARSKGILCHALDGYPEFALRPQHPKVLAQVRAILAFNDASKPEERFHGIHLDNEPYQILGFEGGERENILQQYLELNSKAVELIRAHGGDLVYGVDIPFWFDEEKVDGQLKNMVTYNGVRKDVARHIIDICDNVGIMDYRNFAGGADGIIRHGQGEIEYAEKVGKRVYIGLETFKYEPTPVYFLYGMADAAWQSFRDTVEGHLLSSTVDGFRVRTMKVDATRLIGLARKKEHDSEPTFREALRKLYAAYGATTGGRESDLSALSFDAEFAISQDDRYTGFEPFEWTDSNGRILAAGFRTTESMLAKITFADLTKSDMEAAMKETSAAFSGRESFLGFAIHYYDTYRRMED